MDFIERIKERIGLKNKPVVITREPPVFQKGSVIKDDDYTFHMRFSKNRFSLGCNSLKTSRIQIFLPLFKKAFGSPKKIRRNIIRCLVHEMLHREVGRACNRKVIHTRNPKEVDYAFFEERMIRELCSQDQISVLEFVQSAVRFKKPQDKPNEQ